MLLTCSRVGCAVEFRARNVRKYCCKECSGLARRRPRGNCLICGRALIGPTQRVACSSKCAGTIGSIGTEHDQGIWGVDGTNSPDRLRVLWDEGHSTSEIGRRMDITKNAVIGKAHRLGLPARPSPIRGRVPGAPQIKRAPRVTLPVLATAPILRAARKAPPTPPQRAPEAPKAPAAPKRRPEAETLLPRAGTPPRWGLCQFPTGDRPFKWCGQPVQLVGSPYCNDCRKIAYNRPVPFRDAATESAAA